MGQFHGYDQSVAWFPALAVALLVAGCGDSASGEEPGSQTGPGVEELVRCDGVRAVYDDAMQDVNYGSDRDEIAVAKLVARRAVERMRELDCADVPPTPD